MRVRLVARSFGDLPRVLQELHRQRAAVIPVIIILAAAPRRFVRDIPDDLQVTRARLIYVRRSRPPIERRLVMRPGFAPVSGIAPRPEIIPERFLHFCPDTIAILGEFDITDERLELLPGVFKLRIVEIARRRLGAPERVREPEINPARTSAVESLSVVAC